MAIGTQLYNKSKEKINPISDASVITCTGSGKSSNVHADIADLYEQISKLTGDEEAASNIIITVHYKRSKSKIQSDITPDTGWSTSFISPTSDYPYTWKRTVISYKGDDNAKATYEIVASSDSEIIQTIYRAASDTTNVSISYIDPTTGNDNPSLYDINLPEFWSTEPATITAAAPNAYMSIRTKKDGKWGRFSTPAQYGRWAFDSTVVFKYQVTTTNTVPEVNAVKEDPGEEWLDSNTKVFTGFLWTINATVINGQPQTYNGKIWNGPNLISAVL